ncbi:MAG: Holliday junction ATP-dependent DNA helicase RuvA [Candidatus Nomurabacteria bacterium GW2011_GWA2_41_25]|uniref:Holliday junction branch migration complex subunit RuvA n=2 Tax=Candidatus Nomuraibacteriota TaxID=1752729 RepID=A0A1F6YCN8_9BACT|nr:MAG: Holliday junction ATP-dependent DNA helicase RuvA [Candidatus Nomurabacteria bacterium GW2011_GWA2_41_25]OGI67365.1 MAG: Holliday junction DNA helicase RuvA [Candidatus Nomurabacteria bacterium RIFCSPHIGHO2_01_FULL_41_91]OGI80650.1 MAG: Holliday junction DNA helicase RuvA [Candidatus Nomurabacteria bacterium RIFCSPHIGHO2_02_FULL_41_52]OGI84924.1 MAG: Holliday junction DNA helicase RuvA [Candidatus Nomurabacteria bacterium RIFCSPHIGHO2_12_FULL_42_19]OGI93740.1 MAG: Holliday junction DNA 
MIGSIKGKIVLRTEKFLIVETNGVGYKINVSSDVFSKAKKTEIMLWIHTHVREDMLDLYGFLNREELEFFEMLINVSGIGPKGALAILGITSIETLKKAIGTGDTGYLTKISGIGKKTAEKIVIELRDKIAEKMKDEKGGISLQGELDALEALKSLGYSQNEAREALKKISLGHGRTGEVPDTNTNAKIREALKILSGK